MQHHNLNPLTSCHTDSCHRDLMLVMSSIDIRNIELPQTCFWGYVVVGQTHGGFMGWNQSSGLDSQQKGHALGWDRTSKHMLPWAVSREASSSDALRTVVLRPPRQNTIPSRSPCPRHQHTSRNAAIATTSIAAPAVTPAMTPR